jgi:diguanylate cyclase (GGDEF)-like protein/PAS domain S-box-containing protein
MFGTRRRDRGEAGFSAFPGGTISVMADRDRGAGLEERLLACAPVIVMLVDGGGVITHVSGALDSMAGFTADEVLGTNVLDFIDTSWNPIALDSIGAAMTRRGLQRPMLFRLIRKDGSSFVAEVQANSQWDDPLLQGMAVYVRRCDERMLLDEVVENLASGAPLADTLTLLSKVMGAETLEGDGVVLLDVGEGRCTRTVAACALPAELSTDDGAPGTPWRRALATGLPAWSGVEQLPPPIRSSAESAGYASCWSWPVIGTAGPAACLVLWRRSDEEPDHTCQMALDNLVRVTGLVLERELQVAQIRHAALHDPLTELANRAWFFAHLQEVLDGGTGPLVGVLYVDLDEFKPVNDRLGHGAGDHVLHTIGQRLVAGVREDDLVARLGGDEFAVVCNGIQTVRTLELMAERLTQSFNEPIAIGDELVRVGGSIGISYAPPGACSTDVLIEAADAALYSVKASGRGHWRVIDPMSADAGWRLSDADSA